MSSDTSSVPNWTSPTPPAFVSRPGHRQWLLSQAMQLIGLFQTATRNHRGGFHTLDTQGRPRHGLEQQIHDTTRMVHCFAIAQLIGVPGADEVIDRGMTFLWKRHRDGKNGGYFWGVSDDATSNPAKQAYGHAFVLLAGASAKVVGHPDAGRLIGDVTEILYKHFWDDSFGAVREEFTANWQPLSRYRGQNSNMHLTESAMAAFEATGEASYLRMAERIASLIINRHAREAGWRVAEHFTEDWQVDCAFVGDPVFRPSGTTPGHALEWSRLLVQLWELGGRKLDWLPEAAKALFFTTVSHGWDKGMGGFYYTLDWDNRPDQADRFWWPCAEGIAAAHVLSCIDKDPRFEEWYRRIWGFVANHVIDRQHGGWHPELDGELKPVSRVFTGKPDLYHALQACVIPLLPQDGSVTRGLCRSPDLLVRG